MSVLQQKTRTNATRRKMLPALRWCLFARSTKRVIASAALMSRRNGRPTTTMTMTTTPLRIAKKRDRNNIERSTPGALLIANNETIDAFVETALLWFMPVVEAPVHERVARKPAPRWVLARMADGSAKSTSVAIVRTARPGKTSIPGSVTCTATEDPGWRKTGQRPIQPPL